jgi:polysaccharide export outer membrane protein
MHRLVAIFPILALAVIVWPASDIAITPQLIQQYGQKYPEMGKVSPDKLEAAIKKSEQQGKKTEAVKNVKSAPLADSSARTKESDELSHFEIEVNKLIPDSGKVIRQFGYAFFNQIENPEALSGNQPALPGYIVGPGDELIITTWGRESQTRSVTIDKDGMCIYPPLAPFRVAGLSFSEAQKQIKAQVENISGIFATVTVGQLKSIRVFVVGDVNRPGAYLVPSGSTISNALYLCGGIKKIGSLRQIELRRRGSLATHFDLYRLLLQGKTDQDLQLLSDDVIFIPVIKTQVAVIGMVQRPAIYETKSGESLQDVIRMAGGLLPDAYNGRLSISRYQDNDKRMVLDIPFSQNENKNSNPMVNNGDIIETFKVAGPERNAVFIFGNFLYPGKYEFKPGLTLKALIPDQSKMLPETYLPFGIIRRISGADEHEEIVAFSPEQVYNQGLDIELQPMDKIYLFNRWDVLARPHVSIKGNVRDTGDFAYSEGMRISDLILMAKGLLAKTYLPEAHLLKAREDSLPPQVYKFSLSQILQDYSSSENLVLGPNDQVVIFPQTFFSFIDSVTIDGEVNNPGTFGYASRMTTMDLVKQAGGFTQQSYRHAVEIVRKKIVHDSIAFDTIRTIALKTLGEADSSLLLKPFDRVSIRGIIDFEKSIKVVLRGAFMFPGVYYARPDERLRDIIQRAGGFKPTAFIPGLILTRERVRQLQQQRMEETVERLEIEMNNAMSQEFADARPEDLNVRQYLLKQQKSMLDKLKSSKALGRIVLSVNDQNELSEKTLILKVENGDVLEVAEQINTISILGEVFSQVTLVYSNASNSVGECLDFSGGPNQYGDLNSTYLIKADGTVVTPKTIGFFSCFNCQAVGPGDVVIVPTKIPKIRSYLMQDVANFASTISSVAASTSLLLALYNGSR